MPARPLGLQVCASASLDSENGSWLYTADRWVHCGGSAGDTTSKTSWAAAAAGWSDLEARKGPVGPEVGAGEGEEDDGQVQRCWAEGPEGRRERTKQQGARPGPRQESVSEACPPGKPQAPSQAVGLRRIRKV